MEGFFTKKETESKSRPDGKVQSCVACGSYKKCKTPKMPAYGNFKKKILVIGESPGEVEDKKGIPFQNSAGRLLQKTFFELGIDLFEDCLCIYSVLCRITDGEGETKKPSNFEVECCRRSLLKVISEYKPHVILLLGNTALFGIIGQRWKKSLDPFDKWRGWTIPDQDYKAYICPVYDPAYVLSSKDKNNWRANEVVSVIWKQDLENAFSCLNNTFPIWKEPTIKVIDDLSIFENLDSKLIAFDYETTGLKPHAKGHRIVCVSIAVSEDLVYVFMMPNTRKDRLPFTDLLENNSVGKVAQNMKFEHTWSKVRLKVDVVNWSWDTMLASHIIDNRTGITGLKFQAYVQFGIIDYSSEIAPYLESEDSKDGNGLNKIHLLLQKPGGKMKLLNYCAYDSIIEYRLHKKQVLDTLPF